MTENEKPKREYLKIALLIITLPSFPVWLININMAIKFMSWGFQMPSNIFSVFAVDYFRWMYWLSVIVSVFTPIILFLAWRFRKGEERYFSIPLLVIQALLLCTAFYALIAFTGGHMMMILGY